MDTYTYLKMPLAGGCEKGETDGGLLKLGRGALITYGESTYTGPTRVYGGILRNTGTADPKTPFGTGTVDVDSAVLGIGQSAAQTLASDAGAVFSYGGGASLMFWNTQTGGDVTIGPAGAACGEALVRKERGVLTLGAYECGNTLQLGGTHKIRVVGGMPLDEQTKIVKAPVFSALPEGKKEWVFLRHLTYDAQNGFIPAVCTEGLGGGATSVARITTTPVSLASDAHVGALDLSYITADGKVSVLAKCMGKIKAQKALLDHMQSMSRDIAFPMYTIYSYGTENCEKLEEKIAALGERVDERQQLGLAIGAHVGPGAAGFVFVEKA
jgi:autotransporter-associated beta strand protein